jgi:hypothetical protein
MAHHQGMSLLAIAHVLLDRPMQRRFEADPQVQSALLLLQERVPRVAGQAASDPTLVDARNAGDAPAVPLRVIKRPDPGTPAVQVLSNGRYHVMLTSAGGGYSRWRDVAVTRWREDPTRDAYGSFCYLRDLDSGRIWSTAFQPTLVPDDAYEAVFTEARVEFRRRLDRWEVHTEIVVSPEDDIELRRTRITNRAGAARGIEVTSYAEVVLAPAIADSLHPAFSKLFVQTEIVASRNAILCSRRPRSAHDSWPWMFHLLAVHDGESQGATFETDRARFLGRLRTAADPAALERDARLTGSSGSVLDPIVAIRHRIRLQPGQTVHVDFVTGVGSNREHCLQLVDKYHDRHLADRVIDLAWTHSQVSLRQINISEAEAQTYARLAGRMLYSHAVLRADAQLVLRNRRAQPGLWAYAISGDLPIMLVQISEVANLDLAREAVQAHAYWRTKGVAADLVIWNEERGGYRQNLHDALMGMVAASVEASMLERPGGILVRAAEQIPHEDRVLLLAVARIVLSDKKGSLREHLQREPNEIAQPRPGNDRKGMARGRGRTGRARAAAAPPRQRVRRLFRRRPRVRDRDAPGRGDAGALDQRDREPDLRLHRVGERRRLHLARERARVPPHPLVQRSGQRRGRRGLLHPRRGERQLLVAVSPAGARLGRVRHPPRLRLQRVRAPRGRHRVRAAHLCRAGRAGQVHRAAPAQRLGPAPLALGHRLRRMGTRRSLVEDGDARVHRARSAQRRAAGPESFPSGIRRPGRLLRRRRAQAHADRGQARVHRPQRQSGAAGGDGAHPPLRARRRADGPVRRDPDPVRARGRRVARAHLPPRRRRERRDASALVHALRKTGSSRAALGAVRAQWWRLLGTVQVETPDESLNALANGWLLYQVIGCRSGVAAATTSPAAHLVFATSSRTRWPWRTRRRS